MDIDKIIEGLSGKRKQACEMVRDGLILSVSYRFWALVSCGQWGAAAAYLYDINCEDKEAEVAADMLWEG